MFSHGDLRNEGPETRIPDAADLAGAVALQVPFSSLHSS